MTNPARVKRVTRSANEVLYRQTDAPSVIDWAMGNKLVVSLVFAMIKNCIFDRGPR